MNSQMLNRGTLSLDLSMCVSLGSGLRDLKDSQASFQTKLGTLVPSAFAAFPEGSRIVGWRGSPEQPSRLHP